MNVGDRVRTRSTPPRIGTVVATSGPADVFVAFSGERAQWFETYELDVLDYEPAGV